MQKEYSKEQIWERYARLFENHWNESAIQLELLATCKGHLDIAKVISYHHGDHSLQWMTCKIPALGNLTPLECVNNHNLRDELKACLCRFPV